MGEDKNQLLQGGARAEAEMAPIVNEAAPTLDPHQLRVSRRTRNHIELILAIAILVIAYGFWSGGTKNRPTNPHPATSPDSPAGDGDLESAPEVKYATRGA